MGLLLRIKIHVEQRVAIRQTDCSSERVDTRTIRKHFQQVHREKSKYHQQDEESTDEQPDREEVTATRAYPY